MPLLFDSLLTSTRLMLSAGERVLVFLPSFCADDPRPYHKLVALPSELCLFHRALA
eukprot:m.211053 g.211053  ORF g.211053 m.211053 type:complete len:56 (+) comp10745_c0_seq2:1646-1813(+)